MKPERPFLGKMSRNGVEEPKIPKTHRLFDSSIL